MEIQWKYPLKIGFTKRTKNPPPPPQNEIQPITFVK